MALFNQHNERLRGFPTKADALTGGVLENLIGEGTVHIHREVNVSPGRLFNFTLTTTIPMELDL